jgi:hypothetical protein
MSDKVGLFHDGEVPSRMREVRRGEYAREVAIADSSIPGSGLFFSTDNEMMIAPRTSVLSIDTEGPTVPAGWTQAHLGSGAATHANGELFLAPNATPNSRARVTSTRIGRRRAGATQWYISVWRLPEAPVAGNVRRWGMYDDSNGFFFQVDEDGLSVGYRKGGVDTLIGPDELNGPADVPALDRMNQYNLFYGGLSCRWHVNGRVLHAIGAGVPTEALTASINLPMRAETINSGGATVNARLVGRGVSFHRVSPNATIPEYMHADSAGTVTVVEGPGRLYRIVFDTPETGETVTVYDSLTGSGPVIANITLPGTARNPFFLEYGVEFATGLTIVKDNGSDITVIYD